MKEINFEKVFSIALGVFSFLIIGLPKLYSLGGNTVGSNCGFWICKETVVMEIQCTWSFDDANLCRLPSWNSICP